MTAPANIRRQDAANGQPGQRCALGAGSGGTCWAARLCGGVISASSAQNTLHLIEHTAPSAQPMNTIGRQNIGSRPLEWCMRHLLRSDRFVLAGRVGMT